MKIKVQRESRLGYALRNMQICFDGALLFELPNGGSGIISVPEGTTGKHTISFQIGKKTMAVASVSDFSADFTIVCWIANSGGVEFYSTNSSIPQSRVDTGSSRGNTGLSVWAVVGIVMLTLVLFFFLFRISVVFYLTSL